MNEDYYRFRMESVKQELEFINREAWKYESSNKHKHPFYKTLFTKLFSGKSTISNCKHFENGLESRTKGKRENYGCEK